MVVPTMIGSIGKTQRRGDRERTRGEIQNDLDHGRRAWLLRLL